MYSQLRDYDECHGFGLSGETDLTAISYRIYERFSKPSWLTLKHHLFAMRIPNKLFRDLRETHTR